jgi:hypothetical protein
MQNLHCLTKEEIKKKIVVLQHSVIINFTSKTRERYKKRINELKVQLETIK